MSFKPTFGALLSKSGVNFKIWAPTSKEVKICLYDSGDHSKIIGTYPLKKSDTGVFEDEIKEAKVGSLYKVKVDEKDPFPDPTSRFQPDGVHGPSQVVDFDQFKWTDQDFMKNAQPKLVDQAVSVYELHVGTFTPEGTYKGVISKLSYLKDLGVDAIQLMPLADFPGRWNWGYDGVALYAPARCYGTPYELMELINEAHKIGLAVFLDVVYNHFGPDGNYLSCFCPNYFTEHHHTPWGAAVNIDLASEKKDEANKEKNQYGGVYHSEQVRKFFIDNGLNWIINYHIDGLRMDATHELIDTSDVHFLKEFHQRINSDGRKITIVAEDARNLNSLLTSDGYGLDGVWADDFHHQVRVNLNGDNQAYYADFSGSVRDLVETIRKGWFYSGQKSVCSGENRGTDATTVPRMKSFVYCIQNHDQIGNRAMGERLNHQISLESYKVASALLLMLPQTPMLFQGQEWATSSPFCYFTDHNAELGKLVTEGRRREFSKFKEFIDPETREKIPDPQAQSTFELSKVKWGEINDKQHSSVLNLYKAMLKIRKDESVFNHLERNLLDAVELSDTTLAVIRRGTGSEKPVVGVFKLKGQEETISLDKVGVSGLAPFFTDSGDAAPVVTNNQIKFNGPAVVILK